MGKLMLGTQRVSKAIGGQLEDSVGKYEMNVGEISPERELPDGYLRLEYIQSTGTQYIDTTDYISGQDEVKFKIIPSNQTGNAAIYGSSNGSAWNNGAYELFNYNDQLQLVTPTSNSGSSLNNFNSVYNKNEILEVDVKSTKILINNIEYSKTTLYSSYSTSRSLYIFSSHRSSGAVTYISCKLFSFEWYRNSSLLHNFIPALRTSDYKPGLYDTVNNVFYTNAGTGEFSYKLYEQQELPSGYKRLEYIQSTGTQYINTGYAMTTNSGRLHCEYEPTESIGSTTIWGAQTTSDNSWMINQYNDYWWVGNTGFLFGNSQGTYYHVVDWSFSNGSISGTVNENYYSGSYSGTVVSGSNIGLFAAIQGTSAIRLSKVKIYNFILIDDGTLVRNFIPAIRISDYKPGLYDTVNNVFYTNAGTGEFLYEFAEEPELPTGYTKLEYIQSTGTQYIDTQYLCSPTTVPNTRYVLEGSASDIAVGNKWWANGIGGNSNLVFYVGIGNGSSLYFVYGDGRSDRAVTSTTGSYNTRYKWDLDMYHSTYKVWDSNGTQLVNITPNKQTPTASQYLTLCRWRYATGSTGYTFSMRIYNVELYTSDVLQMKLIPALRNLDSKPGLYDVVNNYFYTNAGTGEFTYPVQDPSIKFCNLISSLTLPVGYRRLEYIQSTGTQYINSNYYPNVTTGLETEFQFTEILSNQNIFWVRWTQNPTYDSFGFVDGSSANTDLCFYRGSFNLNAYWQLTGSSAKYTDRGVLTLKNGTFKWFTWEINCSDSLFPLASTDPMGILGGYNQGWSTNTKAKLWSFKIWDNGSLVRNFIPALRTSDSKPGLYDTVNNVFYINAGTGEFTYA